MSSSINNLSNLSIPQLFAMAQQFLNQGAYDKAEIQFKATLKRNPNIQEAKLALAFIYIKTNRHKLAEKTLLQLLKHNPNNVQLLFNLANCHFEQAQYIEAIKYYKHLLTITPTFIDALINCGIAYRLSGNYKQAISHIKQALDADKSNARAFHVLGTIYFDQSDYARALECYEHAKELDPTILQYRLSFAETLHDAGLISRASIELHSCCEDNPNNPSTFIHYGNHLASLSRYTEAIESFSMALKLDPNNPLIFDSLGKCYLGMNDVEKALALYQQGLNINPDHLDLLDGLGKTHLQIGNTDKVASIAQQINSKYKSSYSGYILLASAKKSTISDKLPESLLKCLKNKALNDGQQADIHFALGKVYDDRKEHQSAFDHYKTANNLKNKTQNYSQDKSTQITDSIINCFTKDFCKLKQDLGSQSQIPIMILGMPRSGSTLIEQIISSHPSVIGAGEVIFWNKAPTALPLELGHHTNYLECIKSMTPVEAKKISEQYLTVLSQITGKDAEHSHITDKMPHNFLHLGLIALLFPNIKFIHTKRNPIDTCLSIYFQNFNTSHNYATDLANIAHHYKQYQRIMNHWYKVLPERIIDIEYENTIADPEYWTRSLINEVGLEWNDACLSPHKLERTVKTASLWQVRQPIYKTSVERWKNYEAFIAPLIEGLK